MIVLEDRELVIITPPHTGSRHLHKTLCSPAWGGIYVVGPAPDGISFDQHVARVPEEWWTFRKALVVRNPRTRLMGLFRHHNWWIKQQRRDEMQWSVFVRSVARDDWHSLSWLYRFTISRLVRDLVPDEIIRFEALDADVSRLLGTPVDVVPAYTYDDGSVSPVWNKQLCNIAAEWLSEDAARFGYLETAHAIDQTAKHYKCC
jgi:hypothetical protein